MNVEMTVCLLLSHCRLCTFDVLFLLSQVLSASSVFVLISDMVVVHGGALAVLVIYFLVVLADGVTSGLLLLGIRDGVVRTRLNIWLVWNVVYTAVLVLLVIVGLSVWPITAGLSVLAVLQTAGLVGFRVYAVWAGWKYREDLMAAPPPATQHRPDLGAF